VLMNHASAACMCVRQGQLSIATSCAGHEIKIHAPLEPACAHLATQASTMFGALLWQHMYRAPICS
jgi:hypothetical protein